MPETLEEYLEKKKKEKETYKTLEEIYYQVREGKIRLKDPNPPQTFTQYLLRPEYNLWLYTSLTLLLATLVTIWLTDKINIITPLRYILGSIYVLFLPGYSLIEALYPEEGRLTDLEKLALSIGLSLAIVPIIGLTLNYTPWGIRLKPYTTLSSIIIISLLMTATHRKYKQEAQKRLVKY